MESEISFFMADVLYKMHDESKFHKREITSIREYHFLISKYGGIAQTVCENVNFATIKFKLMFGLYTPVLMLQAFCVYHAYQNQVEYRWYWFIIFFPVIGSAVYIYHQFYNRKNASVITETFKGIVNTNYKVEQLEKAFRFSDNIRNRFNLAEAYIANGKFEDAITLYKDAMIGFMADDPALHYNLLQAYYFNKNYAEVIHTIREMEQKRIAIKPDHNLAYAWALHHCGNSESAEKVFTVLDKSFSNYNHRLEYCKFLIETGRVSDMRVKATELLEELEHLKGPERKFYRGIIQELKGLYNATSQK